MLAIQVNRFLVHKYCDRNKNSDKGHLKRWRFKVYCKISAEKYFLVSARRRLLILNNCPACTAFVFTVSPNCRKKAKVVT